MPFAQNTFIRQPAGVRHTSTALLIASLVSIKYNYSKEKSGHHSRYHFLIVAQKPRVKTSKKAVHWSGFAIITWNNPKKLEKPCITKGLATSTCQSLGARFSHVTRSLWWTPLIIHDPTTCLHHPTPTTPQKWWCFPFGASPGCLNFHLASMVASNCHGWSTSSVGWWWN